jgi:dTDP-glucose pyrophosphorylase
MNILIPMAGAGSRFQKEGYTIPKPLIPVDGTPMVIKATKALPKGDKHIFICRDFHISEYKIEVELKKYYPEANIITVDKLTEGQASTCLFAETLINNKEELCIGASDNGMIYENARFEEAKKNSDCLIFTFRNNVTVVPKPKQYGWVATDAENNATKISVKIPVSDNPIKDHAIVGAFWFKEGSYFVEAAHQMIAKNRRVNGEFYVDECINDLISSGKKVKVFEIDYYICWGTPDDLKTYEYWENFFVKK